MREIKRKRKKNFKKRVVGVCLFLGLLILLAAGSYFFYVKHLKKPLYISPISGGGLFKPASDKDDKLDELNKLLREKKIQFSSVTKLNDDYVVQLRDKSEVIISPDKNIESQIASLQVILSRLTMESRSFKRLDLRFDKPVILLK